MEEIPLFKNENSTTLIVIIDQRIYDGRKFTTNKLLFAEGNAIKYICRHASKGEVYIRFVEKAKHYIDMIIERDLISTDNQALGLGDASKGVSRLSMII